MNNRLSREQNPESRRNIADYITAGWGVFLRRPWVMLLLVAWDMWLLLSPRLGVQAWIKQANSVIAQIQQRWSNVVVGNATVFSDADARTSTTLLHQIPSLFSAGIPATLNRYTWDSANSWITLAIVLLVNGAALVSSTIVLMLLSDSIVQRTWSWQRVIRAVWRLFKLELLVFAGCCMFAIPAIACAAFFVPISAFVSQVIMTAVLFLALVVWFYTGLCASAICVGDVTPLLALYQGYNIVRVHFRAASSVILGCFIVSQGIIFLVRPLATTLGGVVAASLLVAIASSTTAATKLLFYHERVATLPRQTPINLPSEVKLHGNHQK